MFIVCSPSGEELFRSTNVDKSCRYIVVRFSGTYIRISDFERGGEEIKKEIEDAAQRAIELAATINLPPEEQGKQ